MDVNQQKTNIGEYQAAKLYHTHFMAVNNWVIQETSGQGNLTKTICLIGQGSDAGYPYEWFVRKLQILMICLGYLFRVPFENYSGRQSYRTFGWTNLEEWTE